ncbi:carboxymuconolactone decarboxylase family protein [Pseudoalteromonas denitrificans]|jgi:AhpD family alkylhydroperoxidase|uniref:Alkylhydroperoxidase AhpD family core domain-containing protein n=1 Tax=Pseudoalteromonas denitrificans DSM 6059 TaxID=1123010 RepID=A0A1I1UYF3_9GAMM|nr:carboxymuconolactone decarboxylase family protein [Pseudoalteromonas denitrificans]SFD74728.1 alkylhydroperoxidase AhpD family core domain-containing protein [Pseudoalteromonas denitrificans DSM 6059]
MNSRLNYFKASPEAINTILNIENYISMCCEGKKTLDVSLCHLIKIRVSQINGCAYCIGMHTKEARAAGETEQRIYALNAWRETPFFSDAQRAALAWAEANTIIHKRGVSDKLFENVKQFYSDEQIVDLTLVITTINTWNRIGISFQADVGGYSVEN